jgi:hypothetical protein
MNEFPEATVVAEAMKKDIIADIQKGRYEADKIHDYSDLHDYVDANMYGLDAFPEEPEHDDEAADLFWEKTIDLTIDAQYLVDAWIKAGGHLVDAGSVRG